MTYETQVEYRYFLTDLLTNQVISEVPFKGVSYERANRRAGAFSGSIPFLEATKGLDLYEATMPGRTGLYVMRNGVCVWGGIIWTRSYDVASRSLEVNGSEFMSYFYRRQIWQTIQYGSQFIGIASYQVASGVGTIVTEFAHGFRVGQVVRVTFTNPTVDGTHTITEVPDTTTFKFTTTSGNSGPANSTSGAVRSLIDTYDFARDLIFRASTDLDGIYFASEVIKPAKELEASVVSKQRSAGIVTLRTEAPHEAIPGQSIEVMEVDPLLDGFYVISEVPNNRTIRYESAGSDIPALPVAGIRSLNVFTKQLIDNVATIVLEGPHGATVGQTVILTGVDGFFTGRLDSTFNGRFTITAVPTPNSFSYSSGGILNVPAEGVAGGLAFFGSKVLYGDFGSYTSNGDIGVKFENFEKSGFYQDTQIFRGFEQKTVGEILEQYSNTVEGGFEYRIDCDYDYDTATFSRTFRLLPIDLAEAPPEGDVYPVTAFGAEKLVWEYPGNIITFTVEESAEDAATRFFVIGNIEDLADEASQPYAGAADKELLNNKKGRSWPLLDQVEQLDEIEDELTLYEYAKDYLYEAKPPIGVYTVIVNGSIYPQVGTFFPGEWCSLIVDDEFVRQRLANDQEPRDDILIRKINSYTVAVPDQASVPEVVTLALVTDWKVDQSGN
jgi:hypothetical protein